MRRALILRLAERRNSIPTNCEIECDAPFLGCLPRIADGFSGARKKGVPSLRKQPPAPKPPIQESAWPRADLLSPRPRCARPASLAWFIPAPPNRRGQPPSTARSKRTKPMWAAFQKETESRAWIRGQDPGDGLVYSRVMTSHGFGSERARRLRPSLGKNVTKLQGSPTSR